jgi:hypothetical protein
LPQNKIGIAIITEEGYSCAFLEVGWFSGLVKLRAVGAGWSAAAPRVSFALHSAEIKEQQYETQPYNGFFAVYRYSYGRLDRVCTG